MVTAPTPPPAGDGEHADSSPRRRRFLSPLPGVLGPRAEHDGGRAYGGSFAGIGLKYAITIVVFTLFGLWLDRTFGTSPWLLLVGIAIGMGGGFYSLVLAVGRMSKDGERSARRS